MKSMAQIKEDKLIGAMGEGRTDEFYMLRCIAMAKQADPFPNPAVGCVIVKDGRIVGEGFHKKAGEPHAEINALHIAEQRSESVEGATLFCSLEPCFHFGRTPQCVDAVIKAKVGKVIISALDPNPLTHGKSVEKLRENGIIVVEGVLQIEGKKLIKKFAGQFDGSFL